MSDLGTIAGRSHNTVKYGQKGAELGAVAGGPYGAVAGGVGGGVYGWFRKPDTATRDAVREVVGAFRKARNTARRWTRRAGRWFGLRRRRKGRGPVSPPPVETLEEAAGLFADALASSTRPGPTVEGVPVSASWLLSEALRVQLYGEAAAAWSADGLWFLLSEFHDAQLEGSERFASWSAETRVAVSLMRVGDFLRAGGEGDDIAHWPLFAPLATGGDSLRSRFLADLGDTEAAPGPLARALDNIDPLTVGGAAAAYLLGEE